MTPENFCYWLQGFIEISGLQAISEEQVNVINDHLKLVFQKVTPSKPYTGIRSMDLPDSHPHPSSKYCALTTPGTLSELLRTKTALSC